MEEPAFAFVDSGLAYITKVHPTSSVASSNPSPNKDNTNTDYLSKMFQGSKESCIDLIVIDSSFQVLHNQNIQLHIHVS